MSYFRSLLLAFFRVSVSPFFSFRSYVLDTDCSWIRCGNGERSEFFGSLGGDCTGCEIETRHVTVWWFFADCLAGTKRNWYWGVLELEPKNRTKTNEHGVRLRAADQILHSGCVPAWSGFGRTDSEDISHHPSPSGFPIPDAPLGSFICESTARNVQWSIKMNVGDALLLPWVGLELRRKLF